MVLKIPRLGAGWPQSSSVLVLGTSKPAGMQNADIDSRPRVYWEAAPSYAPLLIGQDDLLLLRTSSEALPEAPDLPVYTDIESALAQDPDLMIVANPAPFHIQTALRAATAGVHLFIEKPLSNTWEKVTEAR